MFGSNGAGILVKMSDFDDCVAGCWIYPTATCLFGNYQVAAGKKFWTFKDTEVCFATMLMLRILPGCQVKPGCFNPRIWFGTTISENRKTTAEFGCLAPRPGPFSIGLVAQPFFGFCHKKDGLGKFFRNVRRFGSQRIAAGRGICRGHRDTKTLQTLGS